MLPKKHRLNLKIDRNRVTEKARTVKLPTLTLLIAKQDHSSHLSRFAVITSKKLTSSSVARHRLKRKILQVINQNISALPAGLDVIIIPHKSALTFDYQQLAPIILNGLKKYSLES
ncbi:ribonuclease P protein component [Candidatus Collierbacteria bacterium]|nr:ribonuclease P protein component [Candidatus Collierbacteria bacterium]